MLLVLVGLTAETTDSWGDWVAEDDWFCSPVTASPPWGPPSSGQTNSP